MRKIQLIVATVLVLMVFLMGNLSIPILAWFDRNYEGYLLGAPSNGRLGYTHSGYVRAWTLDMRWNTTYYVRRDNSPRIDITADCDSGTGADHLHVINWFSNLPGKSFQSWSDCGKSWIKEEGEIFFDKYGISTSVTNYEADVIYEKKLSTANGAIDHSYQRSSGLDPKVCGSGPCGDPNHDWLAKTVYVNYNYDHFEPPEAGWTGILGSKAYASGPLISKEQDMLILSFLGAPFIVQVAKDGEHIRAYLDVDFSERANLQSYVRWNAVRAQMLSANLKNPIPVKVTFRSPLSIAEAQTLVDSTGLNLEQTTFVGRNKEGQPYSGGTLSDGVDSTIRLGALESIWKEEGIKIDGVMMIEGVLSQGDAIQMLLRAPQVYLVDVTADFALQEVKAAGVINLQGIVVPSPYWWLYLDWLSRQSE